MSHNITQLKENSSFSNISQIITSKGSVYSFLPNGNIERFNTTTTEIIGVMTGIVFLPSFVTCDDFLGLSEGKNEQNLLNLISFYFRDKSGKKLSIVDKKGNEMFQNDHIQSVSPIYLQGVNHNKILFHVQVSVAPKIGYYPFEIRKEILPEGKHLRIFHIGHPVTHIIYKRSMKRVKNETNQKVSLLCP